MQLTNPEVLIGRTIFIAGRFVRVEKAWFDDRGKGWFRGISEIGRVCGGPIEHIGKHLYQHPLLNLWSARAYN